jgi:hypothetical protein
MFTPHEIGAVVYHKFMVSPAEHLPHAGVPCGQKKSFAETVGISGARHRNSNFRLEPFCHITHLVVVWEKKGEV